MTTPPSAETALAVSRSVSIPLAEFRVDYVRSGGPGGQNVNKVASKAQVHWDAVGSPSLPPDLKQRFLDRYRSRLTTTGELVLSGSRFRDQKRNLDDCLERLREMIREVLQPPKPRKVTKPSKASKRRRVEAKRQRSTTKRLRGKPSAE